MTHTSKYMRFTLPVSILLHGLVVFAVFPTPQIAFLSSDDSFEEAGKLIVRSLVTKELKKPAPVAKKKAPPAPIEKPKELEPQKPNPIGKTTEQTFDKSIVRNTLPSYPRKARRKGWEGNVQLKITVSATGTVSNVEVLNSTAHQSLIDSAVKAAKSWIFKSSSFGSYTVSKLVKFQLK